MKFFVWLNDQQQGLFDDEAIQQMISEGRVTHDTLLCPEGGDVDWTAAKEFFSEDLFPYPGATANAVEELNPNQEFDLHVEENALLEIRLSSGAKLKIKAVRLYDEIALAQLNSKKAEAMKMFKGISTGLGAWGSIEWVLAASAVIGAAEAVLSAGASLTGDRLLEEAIQAERKLRKEGVFFPISKIQNIENPMPGFWRVPSKKDIQVEVKAFLGPKMETRNVPSAFVHNGDEFVSIVIDDDSVCSIRWSAVERYVQLKIGN